MFKLFNGLFLWLCVISLPAQENNMQFKHYTVEDGLSQSWVQCIMQDSLGFMWFGTDDGLNRFDGYSFHVYKHNPKNIESLRNNSVKAMVQDDQGSIWIGTVQGLCKYNVECDKFSYQKQWPNQQITELIYNEGQMYIATTLGLYTLDAKSGRSESIKINGKPVLTEQNINSIAFDHKKNLWIGSLSGLYVITGNSKSLFHIAPDIYNGYELPEGEITALHVDSGNRIWIGTAEEGLFLLTYQSNIKDMVCRRYIHSKHDNNSIRRGRILSLFSDNKGKLWIGMENMGLDILDLESFSLEEPVFRHYEYDQRKEKSISSNSIYSFCEDFQGNMWIGTYGGGISFYTDIGENFMHYKHITNNENSLANNNVNVFCEYEDDIWIGTEGGLSRFSGISNTFINYTHRINSINSLSANAVWALNAIDPNHLWIGTWSGGINVFNSKTNSFRRVPKNLIPGDNIFSVYKDSKGIIWIGTMGSGLTRYNPESGDVHIYRTDLNDHHSISSNWVRCIYETKNGELWISTTESVEILDRKTDRFIHFAPDINDTTSLSGSGAYVIFEDSRNNIWFGTQTGLNYFKRKDSTFCYYQEDSGLPNNSVKAILEDAHGNLWISTNKGITKMTGAVNLPEHPVFEEFDVSDGLQGNEFNRRAALKDKNGWMYFGGTNGFNVFHPDSIVKNRFEPPVVLTGFSIFNKPVNYESKDSPIKKHISVEKQITLKYSQSVFSFEFSALNYVNSEKNRYKYILQGFDKDWNEVGTKRQATYTNISPGEYTFIVKASNNDGIWNEAGCMIQVKILPPWYRTRMAYIIYIIFLISLIVIFRYLVLMRARLKHEIELKQIEKDKLDEVHQLKTRFFTNISHEFRTPLTLIISPLNKILVNHEFTDELKYQLNVILSNARRMLRLINQFLDSSKMEAGYLKMGVHEGDMVKYIKTIAEIFNYQAEEKSIEYNVQIDRESYHAWFDSDKVEKILYNFISNAIKFTPEGGRIVLRVHINPSDDPNSAYPGFIEFWIRDNGIGIKKKDQERIYDRFYQADNSGNKGNSGTGIGLSLAAGLIKKYGGELDISSEYGKGTEFYFRLPFEKDQFEDTSLIVKSEEEYLGKIQEEYTHSQDDFNQNIRLREPSLDSDSSSTVLIVEDNDELRNYIHSHFKDTYKIIEAPDGKSGYEMALEINPDIIVCDIMMPVMDGMELTRLLKSDETTSHIPVILLTAKTSDEAQVEGLETGADAYLSKPFNIAVLEARIKNLLEGRRKLKKIFSQNIQIEPSEISVTSVDAAFIQKAIALVEKNISNPDFNVYHLSKDMGVSRALLHRKLVALTGLPPSGFIKAMRLKRGAYLLVEGQKTVSEVIYEVGIKSRSYFTKSFKEMFGMSPTDYVENEVKKRKEKDIIS